jgi:hypothetical protein
MRLLHVGLGLLALALLAAVPTASATIDGPCDGTMNGTDLKTTDKVEIEKGATVDYAFSAQSPPRTWSLTLVYGPYSKEAANGASETDEMSISGTFSMEDYAWLGVGLYEVTTMVTLADGSTCSGKLLVDVQGNPLTTAVGAAAAAAAVGGSAGVLWPLLKALGVLPK